MQAFEQFGSWMVWLYETVKDGVMKVGPTVKP